ncbi:MAG: hypothetical protein RL641_633 [Candidatus Parcubacteria bacterium]|jgi:phosphohistidine swiveling domain-containing protein
MPQKFNSPELKDFDSKAYTFFGLWKNPIFSEDFWVSCFNQKIADDLGIKMDNLGAIHLRDGNFFLKTSNLKSIDQQLTAKIAANDEAFFQNMVEVSKKVYENAIVYSEMIKDKPVNLESFKEFVQYARDINFLWCLGAEQFIIPAEERLQEAVVAHKFPAEKVPAIIPKIITPLYYQHREVLDFKKKIGSRTLNEVKKDNELYSQLKTHTEKYPWLEIMNFIGEPLTVERLFEQITHTKFEEDLPAVVMGDVPEPILVRARILAHCGYIKQAGAEYFNTLSERVQPLLKAIGTKLGIEYNEFICLTVDNIIDALEGKLSTQDLKQMAARRKTMRTVMFTGPNNEAILVEDAHDVDILVKEMLPVVETGKQSVKGQVGNPGKYVGKVCIITQPDEFNKLVAGDVLVTTMTTPDYVILMQKAGAIVTDIGGMLCHAAIVSREINKPCVIGTKFATKTLKDGDTVEVDADKGIVTIIK